MICAEAGGVDVEAVTLIVTLLVVDAPLLSVTVRDAVYVPVAYQCCGDASVELLVSPKFQKYDEIKPSGSLADEEKLTSRGLSPEVGVAEILSCGG